jgi:hypothetical protein
VLEISVRKDFLTFSALPAFHTVARIATVKSRWNGLTASIEAVRGNIPSVVKIKMMISDLPHIPYNGWN